MAMTIKTLPQLLLDAAKQFAGKPALCARHRGVWQATRYDVYSQTAFDIALALQAEGVASGDTVLIAAPNSPEWLMADAGIMMAGARSAGLYTDMAPQERLALLRDLAPAVVFCGGHEQVDQMLDAEAAGVLVGLRRIVYLDSVGLGDCTDSRLMAFEAFARQGGAHAEKKPALLRAIEAMRPDTIAVLALTRGVTGAVRAVPLSHAALLDAGRGLLESGFRDASCARVFGYLPLANALARQVGATLPLLKGGQTCFPDAEQDLVEALREIQPDVVALFPNGWSAIADALIQRLELSNRLPARLRERALFRPGAWFSQALFGRGMLRFTGLKAAGHALCLGGAPSHRVRAVFDKIGVNLRYGYGATELAGLTHLSANPEDLFRHPLPDIAATANDAGEIRIAAGARGEMATGDRATGADEGLRLSGRGIDYAGNGGQSVALNHIEDALRESRWVRRAAACEWGEGVHLLIEIDALPAGRWAAERKLVFTDYASLAALPEIRALIAAEIRARLSGVTVARGHLAHSLLDRPFDLDAGELAPVYGLRRHRIAERLAHVREGV